MNDHATNTKRAYQKPVELQEEDIDRLIVFADSRPARQKGLTIADALAKLAPKLAEWREVKRYSISEIAALCAEGTGGKMKVSPRAIGRAISMHRATKKPANTSKKELVRKLKPTLN